MVETGFRLRRDPDTVLAPDVSVVAVDGFPEGKVPAGFIDGLPMLAIEVASPNDTRKDILSKVGEYLDCGVARVWVVREKDRTVIVYGQDDQIKVVPSDGILTSEDAGFAVPGFKLPVGEIFR
jgi:Uma2 family endonuclease